MIMNIKVLPFQVADSIDIKQIELVFNSSEATWKDEQLNILDL